MLESIQEDLITEEQMKIKEDIIEELTKDETYRSYKKQDISYHKNSQNQE